ncbi:MarR family transcriptional regulator [Altererythrobacter sp. GH1-8]|uniref:MarR family transcriptional regulator n=1 Tax=Altererythrobacter sp. GH1-8 TaxID=3349333 RepID=UPI00374D2BE8
MSETLRSPSLAVGSAMADAQYADRDHEWNRSSAPDAAPAIRERRPSDDQRLLQRNDLIRLADQLQALAQELEDARRTQPAIPLMAPASSEPTAHSTPAAASPTSPQVTQFGREHFLSLARKRYENRRKRVAVFAANDLFGEPAWDILLDLYIAYAEGKTVSVSSACIGSASPPTTGLRWLGVLQDAGLVEREHDPHDQRRILVRLSDHGVERMETYFSQVLEAEGVLPRQATG